jgi:hypothetical protein
MQHEWVEHQCNKLLVGKPEGKRPLGRPGQRWADNIKMDLRERGWGGVDLTDVAQNRDHEPSDSVTSWDVLK